ncbi:MAG: EFR1 family ferrodoxin [Bacteroidales bacterium]|nr:EFR1 family ferrodoxin [Bacteroidales bacterium]
MILYFSGCGNSEHIANGLAKLTEDTLSKIDPLEARPTINIKQNEALGIVCPVYAWAVPRIVDEYVKRIQSDNKPEYCYLACTCGDNVGRTPERFAKTLSKKGWRLDAAFSFILPETYINLPGFSLDTQESEKRKKELAEERLPHVVKAIKERKKIIDVERGKMPWFNTYVTNALFYGLLITDKKFHVSDACVKCGICEKVCPLKNITVVEGRPQWNGNCTNCMACYHHCPQNAIHFGKATIGKGQYYYDK